MACVLQMGAWRVSHVMDQFADRLMQEIIVPTEGTCACTSLFIGVDRLLLPVTQEVITGGHGSSLLQS